MTSTMILKMILKQMVKIHLIPLNRIVCISVLMCSYGSGGTNSLKSTQNGKFVEKLFKTILFTLRVYVRNLLRGIRRKNTFSYFILMSGLGLEPWLLHLISQYTTDSNLNNIIRKFVDVLQ